MIKEAFGNNNNFSFDLFFLDTVLKEILSLHSNKTTHSNDAPHEINRRNADLFLVYLPKAFNESIISGTFRTNL